MSALATTNRSGRLFYIRSIFFPIALGLVTILCIGSCTSGLKTKIEGIWVAESFENPKMQSFYAETQQFIDTMGNGHTDYENTKIYGTANMDSLKQLLQHNQNEAIEMQQRAVKHSVFNLMPGGKATVVFNMQPDSCLWFMEDSTLVLKEMHGPTQNKEQRLRVLSLTDTELKLRFERENDYTIVTFKKERKNG